MPMVAGWVYDRYQPRLMRPVMMVVIAGGFLVLSFAASRIPFWALPLLDASRSPWVQTCSTPINNATVMNSLPLKHRGVASGMLETTREMGHALGATTAAAVLALALPSGVSLLSEASAQGFYIQGFQLFQPDGRLRAVLRRHARVLPSRSHVRQASRPTSSD